MGRANMYFLEPQRQPWDLISFVTREVYTVLIRLSLEYFPLVVDGLLDSFQVVTALPFLVKFSFQLLFTHLLLTKLCFKLCKPRIRGRGFRWVSLFHIQRSTKRRGNTVFYRSEERFRVPVSHGHIEEGIAGTQHTDLGFIVA